MNGQRIAGSGTLRRSRIASYFRPAGLREAMEIRAANPDALWLAGGTQVNRAPLDREPPRCVIDVRGFVPSDIRREGTDLIIGAMASLQEIADSELVPPPLRQAASFIPTRSVRNQATIGGNIGAGRPDSYLIPALIALTAAADTPDGVVPVEQYIAGDRRELILGIRVPPPTGYCVVVKESRSHLALPVVSAAVSLTVDEGLPNHGLSGACVAAGCVAGRTIRLRPVEEAIVSGEPKSRADIEAVIRQSISPTADILGSAEYKTYINGVVIADAVIRCLEALI